MTTFHFATLPAPPVNINWGYTYSFTSASAAGSALQLASEWAYDNAPKELGFGIVLAPGSFVVQGVYYGSRTAFDSLIAPLLAQLKIIHGIDPSASVNELDWIASLTALAGEPLELPPTGDGKHDTFVSPPAPVPHPHS